MFVQYCFVQKHDRPAFKHEAVKLGSVAIVAIGVIAMSITAILFLLLA